VGEITMKNLHIYFTRKANLHKGTDNYFLTHYCGETQIEAIDEITHYINDKDKNMVDYIGLTVSRSWYDQISRKEYFSLKKAFLLLHNPRKITDWCPKYNPK
jgi:hypothetical protein